MIVKLNAGKITVWVTGTSAPCTGIFKPIYFDTLEEGWLKQILGNPAKITFEDFTLWWEHELLHRSVLLDYNQRLKLYSEERDKMESDFLQEEEEMSLKLKAERLQWTQKCFEESRKAEKKWLDQVSKVKISRTLPFIYSYSLSSKNKVSKVSFLNPVSNMYLWVFIALIVLGVSVVFTYFK